MFKTSNLAKFIRKEKLAFSKIIFDENKLVDNKLTVISCPNCNHEFKLSPNVETKVSENKEKIETVETKETNIADEEETKNELDGYQQIKENGRCQQFDEKKFVENAKTSHFSAAFVGKKAGGKTITITHLLSSLNLKEYNDILIFKSHDQITPLETKFRDTILDKECWFEKVDDKSFISAVEKITEYQTLFPKNRILIIMEDLVPKLSKTTMKNHDISNLFVNNHHEPLNASIIFSTQHLADILPSHRGNFDYFFFFGNRRSEELTRKILKFCGGNRLLGMSFTEFSNVFNFYTDNYGSLVRSLGGQNPPNSSQHFHWFRVGGFAP
jgi:hypothetical protein